MLRYLTPSRTRNVPRFRFGGTNASHCFKWSRRRSVSCFRSPLNRQASNSSTVRGQSSFSSRDSERSASTRPSVWQRGQ